MLTVKEIRRHTTSSVYARGEAYYNGGRVEIKAIQSDVPGLGPDVKTVIRAQVRGSVGMVYRTELRLTKYDAIYSYDCSCPFSYFGLCKHAVALALAYRDTRQAEKEKGKETENTAVSVRRPASYTDKALREIMDAYGEETRLAQKAAPGDPVHLEPVFGSLDGVIRVECRIGTKRMYVVKNIAQLVRDIHFRRDHSYGAALEFRHGPEAFDDTSRELIRGLETCLTGRYKDLYDSMSSAYDNRADMRSIEFYGPNVEQILNPYVGGEVTFNGEPTRVVDGDPQVMFTLTGKNESAGLRGPMMELYEGGERVFGLYDGTLYRFTPAFAQRVVPLLRLFRSSAGDGYRRGREFTLSQSDYTAFCGRILPALEGLCEVITVGLDLGEWTPPEPAFTLRVRREADDTVAATATVSYGQDLFDLLSPQTRGSGWRDPAEDGVLRLVSEYFPEEGSPEPAGTAFHGSLWSAQDDESPDDEPGDDDGGAKEPAGPPNCAVRLARGEDALWRLADGGLQKLSDVMTVYVDDALRGMRVKPAPPVSIGVSLSAGLLELDFETGTMSPEDIAGVLASYRARRSYHRLKSGEFLALAGGGLQTLSELSEGLNLSESALKKGRARVPGYRALFVDDVLSDTGTVRYDRSRDVRQLVRSIRDYHNGEYTVPAAIHADLRPYQADGFQWLCALYDLNMGGILADDMGLGKTLQMIALMRHAAEADSAFSALIVAPASLLYNWESEVRRFAPDMTVRIIAGTAAEREALIARCADYQVNITSYDLLKRDIDRYDDQKFSLAVVDEAQYVKNAATKAAKSLEKLNAAHRFAMTGTPVENRLSDLWSIFNFIMPGYLYEYPVFKKNIEQPIARDDDEVARARLARMVAPFLLRRRKADVLRDLPDKLEENMYVRLEGEQARLYRAHRDQLLRQLSDTDDDRLRRDRIRVLAELTRLRQLCCSPALCYEDYAGPSAKIDACMELLRQATGAGHRVLVFSQFTSMLELLIPRWDGAYLYLSGSDSKSARQEMVDRFQRGEVPVFFISLKAGGTGLNLTAADVVIHCDPWWNVAAQNQATDRAHRIGQTRQVTVIKLIAADTIEEKIVRLQQTKRDLAEAILSGRNTSLMSLSREELLALLG